MSDRSLWLQHIATSRHISLQLINIQIERYLTLDGLQQVRQLETHQNPSSNSFLHVCELYQLTTTAKKKTATNISNHQTLTIKTIHQKNMGPPVLFSDNSMGLAGSRLGQFIRLNRSLISSSQRKTERFHLWKPMEVKFTEGNLRNLTKTPPNGLSPKNVAIVGVFCDFLGFNQVFHRWKIPYSNPWESTNSEL